MTIFKTFLKVLNKYKVTIIMYVVILIFFAGFNMKNNDNNINFVASTPDVMIISNDEEKGITKDLINYVKENSNIKEIINNEEAIDDAIFYRNVNYVIYIPENFRADFLNKKNPEIKIKSTGDYNASLAEMMLKKYMRIANIYNDGKLTETEIITKVNETINTESKITLTSKLDTNSLTRVGAYYNFTNYCFLASAIYIICLILSSFKNELINKRTIISSISYQKFNLKLLMCNMLFATILWIFYVVLSIILFGNIMFTNHGLLFILNSFIFMLFTVTLAFLLGNIVKNKEAINGIVNVIALGTSFLCGAFVPQEYLPTSVLNIAHILPSYYFIKNNELIKTIQKFNLVSLKPVIINIIIIVIFSIIFIILNNIITRKNQKIS